MTKPLRLALFTSLCALALSACDDKSKSDTKATDKKAESKAAAGDAKASDAKAGDVKADDVKADAPAEPPKVAKIDMKALALEAKGWEGQYNEALESWTYEKYTPAGDGTNAPNRFYVDFLSEDAPRDVEAYAKKLQEDQNFQDMGYLYTAIDKKEAIDGGWMIVGTQKDMNDAEDKGQPSFVLYRAEKNVYCRGGTFVDAKLRDEAIAACKTI